MVCIVVTRNGQGAVYSFPDKKAARLHPLTQAYDVSAADSSELAMQYGRGEAELLVRFAEGRDRSRLIDALEVWKSEPIRRELPFEIRNLLWTTHARVAQTPPSDPAAILRLIEEDRRAVESQKLRPRSDSATPGEETPSRKTRSTDMTEAAAKRTRINENSTIKILADSNPKRGKSADRFALYKDGMTVKAAKEAGVTAADITYDTNKGFISVTEPEAE